MIVTEYIEVFVPVPVSFHGCEKNRIQIDPGDFRCDRSDCARVLHLNSYARLRVHWAPGIPCALLGERIMHNPGASRCGSAKVCLSAMTTLKGPRDQARSSDCFIVQSIQPPDLAPFSPIIPHRGKQNRFD